MSEERELTGEEKRAKLREEYKRELQLRKEIEQRAAQASKLGKVNAELAKMERLVNGDDTDDWTRRLTETAAIAEAKLDIALGNASPDTPAAADLPVVQSSPTKSAAGSKTLGDLENLPDDQPSADQTENPRTSDVSAPSKSLGDDIV